MPTSGKAKAPAPRASAAEPAKSAKVPAVEDEAARAKVKKRQRDGDAAAERKADPEAVAAFFAEHNVVVSGPGASEFAPVLDFAELRGRVEASVLAALGQFERPTPIQSVCWQPVLSGRDVVAIAKTGSGKTLGFLLPALQRIVSTPLPPGPFGARRVRVVVLSPTRELAMQTAKVCEESSRSCDVRSVCIFGGVPKEAQVAALRKGVDVVIATPGRLLQLVREGQCDLECVSFAVLDEADRMLDLGFEADIREIMSLLGSERQTLMFSATWPQQVQRIAAEYVREPVHVRVGVTEELSSNRNVRQIVEVIDEWHRDRRLLELLGSYHASGKNRVLVFVLYKKEAPRLERFLQQNGWNAIAIHSDKTQEQRNHALALFRSGECPLLIATDVASRGLDVRDVTHVINYSFPLTIEDYVHRIGRTGRAGQTGTAHTLFTLASKGLAGALATVLRDAGQQVPEALSKFGVTATKRKAHSMYGEHFRANAAEDESAPKKPKLVKLS